MNTVSLFAQLIVLLILLRWIVSLSLEILNARHVRSHGREMPASLLGIMDQPTYAKLTDYTLAKSQLNRWETTFEAAVLLALLFSGVLPLAYEWLAGLWGVSALSGAAFLFVSGVALILLNLPFDWYAQFHLEERFGFNTTTPKLWWMDRLKGLGLAVLLGCPLLVLILKLVDWMGATWWIWAWASLLLFQLLMLVLAPMLILPLFNKFSALPEGSLKDRLLSLAQRTQFPVQSIQVMDGSKRSRHSNAFFTGFGPCRKIVLFDTLVQQLAEPELEAVLAHEIGHYRKRHIRKMLVWSALSSLAGFYVLSWLSQKDWFYQALGFEPGPMTVALLLFGLLSGLATFWLSPLTSAWSRRFEYEADAYAANVLSAAQPLVNALRKLSEKNLSNLTPHPAYSAFYYSHPTLLEREAALAPWNVK